MIIKLTESDNESVFINPSQIQYFRPVSDDSEIKTVININGSEIDLCVKEEAQEIFDTIRRLTKATPQN